MANILEVVDRIKPLSTGKIVIKSLFSQFVDSFVCLSNKKINKSQRDKKIVGLPNIKINVTVLDEILGCLYINSDNLCC